VTDIVLLIIKGLKMSISDRFKKDLLKIAEIEGISREQGITARKQALQEWLKEWIVELNCKQDILEKNFTSEQEDYIKYHMAKLASQELMDKCFYVDRQKSNIKLKIFALKRELK
jgi:hypothetical protein